MLLEGVQETDDSLNSGSTNNISVTSTRFEFVEGEGFLGVVFVLVANFFVRSLFGSISEFSFSLGVSKLKEFVESSGFEEVREGSELING